MVQSGKIRIKTQSGNVEVPVYETGSSDSNVYESLRIQTSSGKGFIPLRDPLEASYPDIRVQTSLHGTLALHDSKLSDNITVIDDFEDGVMSEYGEIENSGTQNATLNATTADSKSGSYSARVERDGNNPDYYSPNDGGLNYYPVAGDTIKLWARMDGSNNQVVGLGVACGSNWDPSNNNRGKSYEFALAGRRDNLEIKKRDSSGNGTIISSTNYSFSNSTWYEMEIKWRTNGNLLLNVYDEGRNKLASTSATDSQYTEGGIALITGASGNRTSQYAWWDHIRKTGLAGFDGTFEDGDTNEWTVNNGNMSAENSYAIEGSYSAYITGNTSTPYSEKTIDIATSQPGKIIFYYRETSTNNGLVFSVVNSNGNYETGAGSDNPQMRMFPQPDNTSADVGTDGSYGEWIKVTLNFDWANNQVTGNFEQVTGTSKTDSLTVNLNNGVDVSKIQLGYRKTSSTQDWWIDHIQVK